MITIKDIAKELNLSHSVVSRALNSNPDINALVSDKTKELIRETAEKMGFKRNRIAEFMNRGRAATIGVFLPEYSNRLIADLMRGISVAAAENGFPLNFYFGQTYESYEKFIIQNIKNPSSGIISYPLNLEESIKIKELFGKYISAGEKVLLLNTREIHDIPVLYMDEAHGGELAAECLCKHNCSIYLIDRTFRERGDALYAYLKSHKLAEKCVFFSPSDFAKVFAEAIRNKTVDPIGIFATRDSYAAKFMQIINKANYEFGKDVVLTGYDDLELAALLSPPLTTINQPFYKQGYRAVNKLINMIYGNTESNEAIKPFLVKRETA
jgi:DNA-binding LacI/PurR family transcriptional regulator